MNDSSKLLVVGLDGADWSLIGDWVSNGQLPTIQSLREDGIWGTMESSIPPVTCPAWKCYSTGRNPGKLGVFWWETLDIENRKSKVPDARDFDVSEVWDLLNEGGYSTGVIGMPLTYPPKELDGYIVAGGPSVPDSGYTTPASIESDLERELEYQSSLKRMSRINDPDKEQDIVEEALARIEEKFAAADYLHNKFRTDFVQVCTFHLNAPIQHFYYDGEPTLRAWKIIDDWLTDLVERFEYVLIHSDHGTSAMDREFYMNAWLERNGYLQRKQLWGEYLAKVGLNRDNLRKGLERLGIESVVERSSLIQSLGQLIPDKRGLFGEKEGKTLFQKVDWSETEVVASPQGPLYINNAAVDSDEKATIQNMLRDSLQSLTDNKTSEQPIQEMFERTELYSGTYVDQAPELVALDSPRFHNKGGIGQQELFRDSKWKGNNSREGIYILSGPDIDSNRRCDVSIYDLAPTILELFGEPVPEEMDGAALKYRSPRG